MKNPMIPKALGILLLAAPVSANAATVFSFEQGDLRQDGVLYGSGSSYSGSAVFGKTDGAPNNAGNVTLIGNQFRSSTDQANNANYGSNGQQFVAFFSYDLTELSTYLAANPGSSVQDVSFSFLRTATSGSNFIAFNLFQTTAFTNAVTWNTSNGTDPWASPYRSNSTGAAGGGTELANIGGVSLTYNKADPLFQWTTTDPFLAAINDALASPDKTIYMVSKGGFYTNNDGRLTYGNNSAAIDSRPELTISVIPEPSSAILGALGALALLRRRR